MFIEHKVDVETKKFKEWEENQRKMKHPIFYRKT